MRFPRATRPASSLTQPTKHLVNNHALVLVRYKITRHLEQATNQLETGRQIFLTALDLLDNPYELYRTGTETVRSILNRTFFPRLYIDGHKVTGYELHEPFDIIGEAYVTYRHQQAERDSGQNQQPGIYYRLSGTAGFTVTSRP